MRTIDSSISVIKPSTFAWWHSSWTGRFVLAALLVAAAAFALMPDRASALTESEITDACTENDPSDLTSIGRLHPSVFNGNLVEDCVALLTAAQSLEENATYGVDWVGDDVEVVGGSNNWDGVTIALVGSENRITAVNLIDDGTNNNAVAGGTLAPEWGDLTELTALNISTIVTNTLTGSIPGELANLTKLTTLNLSGNSLTGSIPDGWASGFDSLTTLDLSNNDLSGTVTRAVWEHLVGTPGTGETGPNLADSAGLNLSGNPELAPSPPLGLTAAVTKETGGETAVALTWDHTGWYTRTEATDTTTLSYDCLYEIDNVSSDCGANLVVKYTKADGNDAVLPGEINAKGARAKLEISDLAPRDGHRFLVFAVKTTENLSLEGEVSQIDVVGPQTVTAESMYTLKLDVVYSLAFTVDVPTPSAQVLEVAEVDGGLEFDPKVAADSVTIRVTQQSGGEILPHTFPVEILSADTAPTVSIIIPSREVVNQRVETRVDLSAYFGGEVAEYNAESSNTNVATVSVEGSELLITKLREGITVITVMAENKEHGRVYQTFRVRVVSPNNAPQLIGNIPDQTLYLDDEGTQLDMTQYFRDQDNEFLRFIPQSSNAMVVTATTAGGSITFSVTGLGETSMTIIAQDGAGDTAFGSFTVTVLDPNDAPEAVGTIPPQTLRLEEPGVALSLDSYFTDANDDPLTYTAVSADESIVTVEVMEAIATLTAVGLGGATVTVTATDPGEKSATQEILVTVLPANNPPEVVEQIPDQMLQDDDEPLGLDVTEYFTDPDGDELTFVGEGTDDSVAEVRVHSDGVVRIDPVSPGEIEVTVTARDPLGASVDQTFMVMIQGNLPPEAVGVIEDQVLLAGGRALEIDVAEYFSDPNGDDLTYMASSSDPDALQAVIIDGSTTLVLRPLAAAEEVTITVTAMDPEGESAAQLVVATVAAAAPPPTATPEPTTPPPTATPAPTATFVPTDGGGGFPVGLIIVLLLVLAGVAAAVFIIQRRR